MQAEIIEIEAPREFSPHFRATGCLMEQNGAVLLLHRVDEDSFGDHWCVPGGGVEEGETPAASVLREVLEETGWDARPEDMAHYRTFYITYQQERSVFDLFILRLPTRFEPVLNPREHKAYAWFAAEDLAGIKLMPGLDRCIPEYLSKLHNA